MSLELEWSDKLSELWDRISDKDDDDAARDAFSQVADRYFNTSDDSVEELLDAGAELARELDDEGNDKQLYAYEDTYEGTVYVFWGKSENKVFNEVLRAWCENTGRKTKKKGS